MLIHSAAQLLTLGGGPQRGHTLGHLSIVPDGSVLIRDGLITDVGPSQTLKERYPNEPRLDAHGKVVLPGFIDPHTHLVWAGDRAAEFELRLKGKSYLEILASGGGILSTVRATRDATVDELVTQTRRRAEAMFHCGTTTCEAKTGYGLELDSELRQLQALLDLNQLGPLEIVPTFLAAHAVPPEYKTDPDAYIRLVSDAMLPEVAKWWRERLPDQGLPFVDIFCETGVFNLRQSRYFLEKARAAGFPLKIHADEFDNLGGAALAAELGAISADHLVVTSDADIQALARSQTVAVALPCTPFGLGESHNTPAQAILEADGLLAIATDLNPGTAWCENMQFAIALACRFLRLTPAQAIAAATINAAAAIQRQDRIGSIEPGKQADLILLDIPDYRHLGYRFGTNLVTMVIKKGQVYDYH